MTAIGAEPGLAPTALEYMDAPSLDLLRAYRDAAREASGVPQIPDSARAVLYVEASFGDEADVDAFVAGLEKPLGACGIPPDDVWAGFEPQELQAMKKFRHALPERINALVSERKRALPELTKIGTDMAVGREALGRMMAAYREGLEAERLEHYIFGHIGNGHVHVNIVPRSADEMARGKALYRQFARTAVALGGSVAGRARHRPPQARVHAHPVRRRRHRRHAARQGGARPRRPAEPRRDAPRLSRSRRLARDRRRPPAHHEVAQRLDRGGLGAAARALVEHGLAADRLLAGARAAARVAAVGGE